MNLAEERILVTGGTGFLGRHLAAALRARGAEEHPLQRLHPIGAWSWGSGRFNLTNRSDVRFVLDTFRPTLVFHLAARCGGIGANQQSPATFLFDNAMMGLQLVEEASRMHQPPKIVSVGTVCSYPSRCEVPFKEENLWNGYPEPTNAPYGIAKKLLSVASSAYRTERGLVSVVAYPANLYGPGDTYDPARSHVIPALIRKFCTAKATEAPVVELWGSGGAEREFLYAPDCAEALCRVAERYDSPDPINLGGPEAVNIYKLSRILVDKIGYQGEIRFDETKPDGQLQRRVDSWRAERELGWRAETELDAGLNATIADYRARWCNSVLSAAAP